MGSEVEPIFPRPQPVNPSAIRGFFISTLRFATSSPPSMMNDLKSSAQEQLEYMVTEDGDSPLLIVNDDIKSELLTKLEIMREFVNSWVDASDKTVKLVQSSSPVDIIETKLKVVEVAGKVLESIGLALLFCQLRKGFTWSKVANGRLALLGEGHCMTNTR
ncbi:hypothetical protein REPUB_Repub02eG0208200 [Reevesia pubescens]